MTVFLVPINGDILQIQRFHPTVRTCCAVHCASMMISRKYGANTIMAAINHLKSTREHSAAPSVAKIYLWMVKPGESSFTFTHQLLLLQGFQACGSDPWFGTSDNTSTPVQETKQNIHIISDDHMSYSGVLVLHSQYH